ncbi:hypothetical protein BU24DRAFT_72989 [Aaosphaeria arxii CBS 175.79]|uniref:Secreted protein n=1 Tax=Aaosphaeria arxii CBS 175.79 TaxID=1450172 RepID=A0A6A5XB48_9PLEO|nr:uncharacterized protein BU24DRAFT_72989 [Aaosphaeria arxii CBS 175.79]KAF2010192.1 hypothetical protein BU24DRAFT_72989 [Aaosphaeria arxii CBS 175.79]
MKGTGFLPLLLILPSSSILLEETNSHTSTFGPADTRKHLLRTLVSYCVRNRRVSLAAAMVSLSRSGPCPRKGPLGLARSF